MKAWVLTEDGAQLQEHAEPKVRASEVKVRVRAAALNRVDLAMFAGHRHGGAGGVGRTLGVEFSGEVVGVGSEVRRFVPGDRVMGSGAGAFAEFACTDWGRLIAVPPSLDDLQAASLPVALQTMHDALVTQGKLAPGAAVLIHGASSGVGLMGLRIAQALGAKVCIGSSRSAAKRTLLAQHGADLAVDSTESGWVDRVLEATEGKGVDLAIDQVSGSGTEQLFRATRIGGRVVNVGRLGGARAQFDFDLHALRRLRYIGVTFRTRSHAEVRRITQRLSEDLAAALLRGELTLPIHAVFPFEAALDALACMADDEHFGKLILEL